MKGSKKDIAKTKNATIDTIVKDIEELKSMSRHIHSHMEYLLTKLDKHDKRLYELSSILLSNHGNDDWDRVLNVHIDFEEQDLQYTPIDEKDKEDWKKYIDSRSRR